MLLFLNFNHFLAVYSSGSPLLVRVSRVSFRAPVVKLSVSSSNSPVCFGNRFRPVCLSCSTFLVLFDWFVLLPQGLLVVKLFFANFERLVSLCQILLYLFNRFPGFSPIFKAASSCLLLFCSCSDARLARPWQGLLFANTFRVVCSSFSSIF